MTLVMAAAGLAQPTGDWQETIDRVVPAVVALRVNAPRAFDTESPGYLQATGFVVDAERGLILTNRHVVRSGPVVAEAVQVVFQEYVEEHGLEEIGEVFGKGMRIEVGDLLPSSVYAERLEKVPQIWERAFEVNAAEDPAIRASCVEFVLAGLYSLDVISRAQRHGGLEQQVGDHDHVGGIDSAEGHRSAG